MARKHPRSRVALERRILEASSDSARAGAEFDLAVFHDNNSREAEAIPHYEAALQLGLHGEQKAQCLAWLASSLCKTGNLARAKLRLNEAREATSDSGLLSFLRRLEQRIKRDESDAYLRASASLLLKLAKAERRRG